MSETVLFEIGAVIFVAVSTAVFLYGLMEFRDWQDRDDTRADARLPAGAQERVAAVSGRDGNVQPIGPSLRPDSDSTSNASRPSAA
jgi:hypothetical protein